MDFKPEIALQLNSRDYYPGIRRVEINNNIIQSAPVSRITGSKQSTSIIFLQGQGMLWLKISRKESGKINIKQESEGITFLIN